MKTKFTNNLDLPDGLYRAICKDDYNRGECDFTVSELMKPARIAKLEKDHKDELPIEDAADRLWSVYGTVAHKICQEANVNDIVEERIYRTIDNKVISGQIDTLNLERGRLDDYKFVTVWSYIAERKGERKEWEARLNIYAWLLQEKYPVKELRIVGLLRDWNFSGLKRYSSDYPLNPVDTFLLPLWPTEKTEALIRERIKAHEDAKTNLPECDERERWATKTKWALMKKGRKSAIKLYDRCEDAEEQAAPGLYVELRPGASRRCENSKYCRVSSFCDQWKAIKAEATQEIDETIF